MPTHAESTQATKVKSAPSGSSGKQDLAYAPYQFADNRPEAILQRKLGDIANGNSVQRKENNTGLPDQLKSGIENLSGYAMDDVRVHYNSGQPTQLQAHAYAQGTDIHVAPGQERHLAHEAWHVVQQKQGRVKPTLQMKAGVNVNDDSGLEKEADVMGTKALLQRKAPVTGASALGMDSNGKATAAVGNPVFQRYGNLNVAEDPGDDPVLSSQEEITGAGADDYVIVARVVTPTQRIPKDKEVKEGLFVSLTKLFQNVPGNVSQPLVAAPSDEVVADYVAQKKTEPVKQLIEFTTNIVKVGAFAKESNLAYTVYVRIQKKYLTQSKSAESGWMTDQSAPYEIVKGEKDDKHAGLKDQRMSAGDLQAALEEELDAEFILKVQKEGAEVAFGGDQAKVKRYREIITRYIIAKSKE